MKSLAIIYHDADFDGKLSNEVCRYWLAKHHPEAAIHSYGWDYGRPLPLPYIDEARTTTMGWPCFDAIYIVDLSVDELMSRPELRDKIVWIDHHKSAIEKWDRRSEVAAGPGMFTGIRIDGVAACRLCWQWLAFENGPHGDPRLHPSDIYTPSKQDYIDRKVNEPQLIRLAGEYDIWDHRDPNAKTLQFGLRACSPREFRELVAWQFDGRPEGCGLLENVIGGGKLIEDYARNDASFRMQASHTVRLWDLNFLILNGRGNSLTFTSHIKPEHDALMLWFYDGAKVKVSLYHAPGHEDIDLSFHAKRLGGGGHKGACGFTVDTLTAFDRMLNQP
jgi:uncharacterized protein